MKRVASHLALWLGLAAIAFSSIELSRWPTVFFSVKDVMADPDARGVELYDLEHAIDGELFFDSTLAILVLLLTLGAVLAVGFVLLKPQSRGAEWAAAISLAVGSILTRAMATPGAMGRHSAAFTVASWFGVAMIIILTAWALWSPPSGASGRLVPTLVAASLATFCALNFEPLPGPLWAPADFDSWVDTHATNAAPWLALFALLGVVSGLALRVELNLRAAALVFAFGLLLLPRAVAIRRDERAYRPSGHSGISAFDLPLVRKFARASRCRSQTMGLGPLVMVRDHEVIISGALIARTTDPAEFREQAAAKLLDLKNLYDSFVKEPVKPELSGVFLFERDTPLPVVTELLAAANQVGFKSVELVNVQQEPAAWRSLHAIHRHCCVAVLELAEDGTPASSFADWQAFVEAVDVAEEPLKIAPR